MKNKFNVDFLILFRKPSQKFVERWSSNQIQLPFSTKSLIVYYLFGLLKSPKDFRDGLMARFFFKRRRQVILTEKGFLLISSRVLYLFFGSSARTDKVMLKLKQQNSPMIFLVDEFLSLNCLNLEKLSKMGSIVYVSQDTVPTIVLVLVIIW